jgi:hypothetical protein
VQTTQLLHDQEQKEAPGSRYLQEVLPLVQLASGAQRDTLVEALQCGRGAESKLPRLRAAGNN